MRPALWWAVLALLAASAIAPHDRLTWALEIPWVAVGLAWCAWRRPPMTGLLAAALAVHAAVLVAGGLWTYERVPLGEWWKDWFGFERNHYDRLGHLLQGFVPALMVREWFHHAGVRFPGPWLKGLAIIFAVEGFSAIFELIEWAAAIILGGGAAAYLGSQGDPWDAQADMLCCLIGATLATVLFGRWQDRRLDAVAAPPTAPSSAATRP